MVSSQLREDLCYSNSPVYHFEAEAVDYGELFLIEITAAMRARDRDAVVDRIIREVVSIASTASEPTWFEPARRHALYSLQGALDDPATLAYRIAWERSRPNRPSLATDFDWLTRVRFDEVADAARRMFRLDNLSVCYSIRPRFFDASRFRNRVVRMFQ